MLQSGLNSFERKKLACSHSMRLAGRFVVCSAGWLAVTLAMFLFGEGSLAAGCSNHTPEPIQIRDVGAKAGQLQLKLYVRYDRGAFWFTLEQPQKPCEGPNCKAKKTSMEPSADWARSNRGNLAPMVVCVNECSRSISSDDPFPIPTSRTALRGGLDPSDHPPKPAQAIL